VLGGWFAQGAFPEVLEALEIVADALQARRGVELPGAELARAAAFCLTPIEAAHLHLPDLKARPLDYDPAVRDRLLAGALAPDGRRRGRAPLSPGVPRRRARVFEDFDVLLAPASVCPAPGIGQATMEMDGQQVSVRKNLGAYTQPISYIGLPVVAAPVNRPGKLPIGVQIIAPAWREDLALAAALRLEQAGVVAAHRPPGALARPHDRQRPARPGRGDRRRRRLRDGADDQRRRGAGRLLPRRARDRALRRGRESLRFRGDRGLSNRPLGRLAAEIAPKDGNHHVWARFRIANVEFLREGAKRPGRQSQAWARTEKGWKIVSAHVSLLQDGVDQRLEP
jgi:hypothetical protein